jgi:integrase/recombinase XerD
MDNERQEFAYYIKNELKLSKNTIDGYERDVRQFCDFLKNKNIVNIISCTQAVVAAYIDFLSQNGTSPSSLSRKLSALRCFFKYLQRYRKFNLSLIQKTTQEKPENCPVLLRSHEISRLLNAPDQKTTKGIRDKAMLELLCATGIKVTELICLDVSDILLEQTAIRCRHTHDMRIISFPLSLKKHLKKYILQMRSVFESKTEQAFFVNMHGERLTRQGFSKILRGYAEELKLEDRITANSLRFTFAHRLVQKGLTVDSIKDILGHADTSTTKAYLKTTKTQTIRKEQINVYKTIGELT